MEATKPQITEVSSASVVYIEKPQPNKQFMISKTDGCELKSIDFETIITEPNAPRKMGLSRSQDDDENSKHKSHAYEFGSISPTPQSQASVSLVGANRAIQFRKSHTCGSLFAKCKCSGNDFAPSSPMYTTAFSLSTQQPPNYTVVEQNNAVINALCSHGDTTTTPPSSTRFSTACTHTTQAKLQSTLRLSRNESGNVTLDFSSASSVASTNVTASPHKNISKETSQIVAKQAKTTASGTEKETKLSEISPLAPLISLVANSTSTASNTQTPKVTPTSRKSERKPLFQSYSHPDTDFIFTEANKKPSKESLHGHGDAVIKTRGGKVEIKHQKRSSSPNIGQYQILDVAVHPDILVKISPKHSPVQSVDDRRKKSPFSARTTQQRRQLLTRSHEIESGGSTSESEYSFETKLITAAEESLNRNVASRKLQRSSASAPIPTNITKPKPFSFASVDGVIPRIEYNCESLIVPDLTQSIAATAQKVPTQKTLSTALSLQSPTAASKPKPVTALTFDIGNGTTANYTTDLNLNAAQKYFAESGILGPIPASDVQTRKTSKVLKETSDVIEQIKSSLSTLGLRGNNNNQNINNTTNSRRKLSLLDPLPTRQTTPPLKNYQEAPLSNVSMATSTPMTLFVPVATTMTSSTALDDTVTESVSKDLHLNLNKNESSLGNDSIANANAMIEVLEENIMALKEVIKRKDAEMVELRREIHKLKSVLQQTTNSQITNPGLMRTSTLPLSNNSFYGSKQLDLEAANSKGFIDGAIVDNYHATCTGATTVTCALSSETNQSENLKGPIGAVKEDNENITAAGEDTKLKRLHYSQTPVLKKQGVSGESCEISMQQSINIPITKYEKDFRSKQLIKEAIMDNDFLKNIDASQVRELVDSMQPREAKKGEYIIREGAVGAHLYVSAEGEFEVIKNGKVLGVMGPGKAFGELAILYNCTRTASIRVLTDARVWVLDRRVFQHIMMRTGIQRIENSVNFLKSVPLLKNLSEEVLAKIADVLEVEFYPAGTYIIRQGARGDTFFLISQGSVKVTQKISPTTDEKEIRTLERGDYFGEQALINEDKRTANIIAMPPGVECLTLDRDSFTHLIGDLSELKEKNYGDENRALSLKYAEATKVVFGANVKQAFPDLKLSDLEVVATLGIGGFGRVELVRTYHKNRMDTFALKCLKKRHIVDTKQEEHVFSERTIMLTCESPFICRLYRTFRDERYVYMLLEACMGGEIWTMLRDRGPFEDNAAQFIIGCVLQAFEYLHSRGIIYRDLKPENLMLDESGYIKLVDFGFAKYIGNSSKTWTFCGTPEYVAPEIILNKGHDRAVDYWALGILIHELLNGTPPFTANDPMKTYNIILKGIDMISFSKHMSRSAVMLIKRLCRDVPAERLGYQKGGIQDIKKHKWFLGFDWDSLGNQRLIPPFRRIIAHPTDTSYFDKFAIDPNEPPEENSGWDADF
ncbi:cGMP-dependent protein kinase, isozyme 1 [Teleopsis dalmanni]|uniref:cGMP-dependent protein kinase, isozyme 1 n=1 Tax=Teleopsis dalmanni TaxID=139649 RepID=UPI0018CD5CE5|nr:cGMP-dependent protein kinase, isozyme 1 [Teleopsis dalmanni]